MFCSGCGTRVTEGLKFCSVCGTRAGKDNSEIRNQVAKTFSLATIFVGIFGIIGFGIVIKSLLENGVETSFILLMSVVYLGAIVGIVLLLVKQVMKLIGESEAPERKQEETPMFKPAITARLEEHREPASVVEDTTRNLVEVPSERK
ncbi:MAG: zinc ribbon domain-containing protein [Aridibacter famidurans]|nr:zinc ribbon domain-containing protein [Aridibacter famidurans]